MDQQGPPALQPSTDPGKTSWLETTVIAALAALLLVRIPDEHPYLGPVPDATEVYYATINLVEHGRYEIRIGDQTHPSRYPFGYAALLLAPVLWLTGEPRWLLLVPACCAVANVVLIHRLTARLFGSWAALLAALFVLALPAYRTTSRTLLTDVPSVTVVLLIATAWSAGPGRRISGSVVRSVLLGAAAGVATTIRFTNGAILLPLLLWPLSGVDRRHAWPYRLAVALGALPFLLGLLVYNDRRFGSPLRTGYSYWCSVPYDFTTLCFSLRWVPGNLRRYLFPYGDFVGAILITAALGYFLWVGLRRAWSASRATGGYVLFGGVTVTILWAVYTAYFHNTQRFLYPAHALLVPLVAAGAATVIAIPASLSNTKSLARTGALLVLGLALVTNRIFISPHLPDEEFEDEPRQVAELDRVLPEDAVLIASRDPLTLTYQITRGTDRSILPSHRGTEYAGKVVVTDVPHGSISAGRDPRDHRRAKAWGGRAVFDHVATEAPQRLAPLLAERPVFVEASDESAVAALGRLSEHYRLQRVANTPLRLYRLLPAAMPERWALHQGQRTRSTASARR